MKKERNITIVLENQKKRNLKFYVAQVKQDRKGNEVINKIRFIAKTKMDKLDVSHDSCYLSAINMMQKYISSYFYLDNVKILHLDTEAIAQYRIELGLSIEDSIISCFEFYAIEFTNITDIYNQ